MECRRLLSGPIDNEAIVDAGDAVDAADCFLRHLLLEERIDGTFENHYSIVAGPDPNLAAGNMGTGIEGTADALQ
jgi:hypothetical protein